MLRQRRKLLAGAQSFCIETTLATRSLLRFLEEARSAGYLLKLIFLFTPFANVNELRVKQRVMAGGHNISTDTIRRRHSLGLRYLSGYWRASDEAIVLDARTRQPVEIIRKDVHGVRVVDGDRWTLLVARIEAVGGVAPTIE